MTCYDLNSYTRRAFNRLKHDSGYWYKWYVSLLRVIQKLMWINQTKNMMLDRFVAADSIHSMWSNSINTQTHTANVRILKMNTSRQCHILLYVWLVQKNFICVCKYQLSYRNQYFSQMRSLGIALREWNQIYLRKSDLALFFLITNIFRKNVGFAHKTLFYGFTLDICFLWQLTAINSM